MNGPWAELMYRGDKLIIDTVAPLWNKAKNGVKIQKGGFILLLRYAVIF